MLQSNMLHQNLFSKRNRALDFQAIREIQAVTVLPVLSIVAYPSVLKTTILQYKLQI